MEDVGPYGSSEDDNAMKNALKIDELFSTAKGFCGALYRALKPQEPWITDTQIREAVREHESKILELERSRVVADLMEEFDYSLSVVDFGIRGLTRGLLRQLPGVSFDDLLRTSPSPLNQVLAFPVSGASGSAVAPQWVFLRQRLWRLSSLSSDLRVIIEGRFDANYKQVLMNLKDVWDSARGSASISNARHLMERQLWRLLDLRDGCGFGFAVELFFLSLRHLLSTSSSSDSHSAFYVGTFKAITSDWRRHKHSHGTQRVLLSLVCDLAVDQRGLFSDYPFPSYVTDALLELLGNVVEGETGAHIDEAMEELRDFWSWVYGEDDDSFPGKAWRVIARTRAPAVSSS
jgi:hypothetical protein